MNGVWTIEAVADLRLEDGGMAAICEINPSLDPPTGDDVAGWFVRVQSWHADAPDRSPGSVAEFHPVAAALAGRRVRVTVEVLDG